MVALGLCLAGCSEAKGSGACATTVTPEVCQTPAPLRGAERITENWINANPPELLPQPLLDGRYVLTARTLYCPTASAAPLVPGSVQAVLESSGCVLRFTAFFAAEEPARVTVQSFTYGADGTLALQPECAAQQADVSRVRYGFDGSTLQLVNSGPDRSPDSATDSATDSPAYACDAVDTWELR